MQNHENLTMESLSVDAALEKAYRRGFEDALRSDEMHSRIDGCMGLAAHVTECQIMESFREAMAVRAVYRNGPHTILLFADGTKERVTYQEKYGYAYDDEKAIMAAMLKHVSGSSYLNALKAFARPDMKPNLHADMVPRPLFVEPGPDGDVNTLDDTGTELAQELLPKPEEPDIPADEGDGCPQIDHMPVEEGPDGIQVNVPGVYPYRDEGALYLGPDE